MSTVVFPLLKITFSSVLFSVLESGKGRRNECPKPVSSCSESLKSNHTSLRSSDRNSEIGEKEDQQPLFSSSHLANYNVVTKAYTCK